MAEPDQGDAAEQPRKAMKRKMRRPQPELDDDLESLEIPDDLLDDFPTQPIPEPAPQPSPQPAAAEPEFSLDDLEQATAPPPIAPVAAPAPASEPRPVPEAPAAPKPRRVKKRVVKQAAPPAAVQAPAPEPISEPLPKPGPEPDYAPQEEIIYEEKDSDEFILEEHDEDFTKDDEERRYAMKKSSHYYFFSMITIGFFTFLAVFTIIELVLALLGDWKTPTVSITLSPFLAATSIGVVIPAVLLTMLDALLHQKDTKRNLTLSLVPTFVMLAGLAITIYGTNPDILGNITAYLLFVAMMIMLLFDYICIMNYPDVLISTDRETFQEIVPEDLDDLRARLEKQISDQQSELLEEEEKLKSREEELSRIQIELEATQDKYLEEEETIRRKEEELSALEADLKVKSEEFLVEEEEKLKIREEEVIKLQEESEVKSKLYEESQEIIREKEDALEQLKSKLEDEIRRRIEEEEKQRLKDAADDMMRTAKASRILYPFTAIVGQEIMRLSLILNAINPSIGGVLILGQKGTAKSVAVRGLSEILPDIEIVEGCKFNCEPHEPDTLCTECKTKQKQGKFHLFQRPIRVVDLPLNITEDRLVGSIDIEKILGGGVKAFEPGLLAEAHRGVLYVDEINLLDDFIVDLLLDAAAMGINTVEREGLHISHPAEFIIIGSMNPEEGELRPQLIDRLGLQVRVEGIKDVAHRIEIVRHRKDFIEDPVAFRKKFDGEQQQLRKKIKQAKEILSQVVIPPRLLNIIARLCIDFGVHGHRADIIIDRAARTHAALEGRREVNVDDIIIASEMALPHRMRRMPLEEEDFNPNMLKRLVRSYEFGE